MPTTNGVFQLAGQRAEPGTLARAEQLNIPMLDLAAAINGMPMRNGERSFTANIPMNGFKFTGLGTATQPGDAVRFDQIPSQTQVVWSTGTAITESLISPKKLKDTVAAIAPVAPAQTQAVWNTGTDTTESTITPAKLRAATKAAVSASGEAPIFAARAVVQFVGSTGVISTQRNVASVVRTAEGRYTITFTVPMQNNLYMTMVSVSQGASGGAMSGGVDLTSPQAPESVNVRVRSPDGDTDPARVTVAIFG